MTVNFVSTLILYWELQPEVTVIFQKIIKIILIKMWFATLLHDTEWS